MARTEFVLGVKCKQCGELLISFNRFQRTVLCKKCGTHILNYLGNREAELTENASQVTVKVTHKLFSDIYEEV